jgi:hypothetical protein
MYGYARLKHDFQLEEYGFKRRENPLLVTPETVVLNNQPKAGKGPALRLSKAWFEFVRSINTEAGFRMATGPATGWVNEGWNNNETPLVQSLSMGGNTVVVLETSRNNFARLLSYKGSNTPPDHKRFNFLHSPHYVQKFTCITNDEKLRNPGKGIDCYFPLIGAGELWLPQSRIELFPQIPAKIKMNVTSFFRSSPKKEYGNIIGALAKGQELTLRGYAPRGANVWGFVTTAAGKYGYVALLWYPNTSSLQYLTTWQMETIPPLPPM